MTHAPTPASPHAWWTAAETALAIEPGGPALYYRLGERAPIRDPRGKWLRDAAGRTALEAFGALPLADMYRRLAEAGEARHARPAGGDGASASEPGWRATWPELEALVTTFGPLGFGWSRTVPVANPEADRNRATGPRPWQVVLPGPGHSIPRVRSTHVPLHGSWAERVKLGDTSLLHDFLGLGEQGPLWNHQDDLRRALALVTVLGEDAPSPHRIRDAAGGLPGHGEFDVRERHREPIDLRWSEAMRPPRTGGTRWSPFDAHITSVDWRLLGRMMLAGYLSAQLAWMRIGVGLDDLGRIRTRLAPRSLLELIYLQLLEHVEERLQFGVGSCELCGGPILRTRQAEQTRNRAHRGCAAVLRKRRQRERARLARRPEPQA